MKKQGHLRRLSVVFQNDPIYFITTCVAERSHASLASDDAKSAFIGEWDSALTHYGWSVGSFAIMPDHVHFFCRPTHQAVSLSKFVGKWKERTSKKLKTAGYSCPLWEKEFFDHILRSDESYSEKWNYVLNNPVRAGLVHDASEWPYQGHVHFA